MCALLVGLPDVTVLGVGDWPGWLRIVIATELGAAGLLRGCWRIVTGCARSSWSICRCSVARPGWCGASSAGAARRVGGRGPSRTREIASSRCAMTTRAARWATVQVGRHGRTVSEVAGDLGCDWHTVMDAVVVYGTPLIDDPHRFGAVAAVGLDETLFAREGPFRRQRWSTQIVDVGAGPAARRRRLVATPSSRAAGSPPGPRRGGPGSPGRRWICRRRIGRCSTRCCPTPSRSPTRSTSCGSPTRRSMSAAAGCRTRRSGIGAASPIRSTGPGAC